jgi:L-2-hydroxyglutarate oxidase LhgO
MDDFSFMGSGHIIHVQNAPSPAATSSLAIGRLLAERSLDQFGILAR